MSSYRIATRYAKSLLQLADEKGQVDEVFQTMKSLDKIFEENRDLKLMFKSPIIPTDRKLTVVKLLFEAKINSMVYQFLNLMIKKGRESYFHEMVGSFIIQYNKLKHITPVKLTSAIKLDAGLVSNMIAALKKREKLDEIQLKEVIDESLIGGFVLEYDGKMIDSSVSRSLRGLNSIVRDDSYIKKYY